MQKVFVITDTVAAPTRAPHSEMGFGSPAPQGAMQHSQVLGGLAVSVNLPAF